MRVAFARAAAKGHAVERKHLVRAMSAHGMQQFLSGWRTLTGWSPEPAADVVAATAVRAYFATLGEPDDIIRFRMGDDEEAVTDALARRVRDALVPDLRDERQRAEHKARHAVVLAVKAPFESNRFYFSKEAEDLLWVDGPWEQAFLSDRAARHGLPCPPVAAIELYRGSWLRGLDERAVLAAVTGHEGDAVPRDAADRAAFRAFLACSTAAAPKGMGAADRMEGGWAAYVRHLALAAGLGRDTSPEALRAAGAASLSALEAFCARGLPGVAEPPAFLAHAHHREAAATLASACASLVDLLSFGAAMARSVRDGADGGEPGPAGTDAWASLLPRDLRALGADGIAAVVSRAHAELMARKPRVPISWTDDADRVPLLFVHGRKPPPAPPEIAGSEALLRERRFFDTGGCHLDPISERRIAAGKPWEAGFLAGRAALHGLPTLPAGCIRLYRNHVMPVGNELAALRAVLAHRGETLAASEYDFEALVCVSQAWTLIDPGIWDRPRTLADDVGTGWASYGLRLRAAACEDRLGKWLPFERMARDAASALRAYVSLRFAGVVAGNDAPDRRLDAAVHMAAREWGSLIEIVTLGAQARARGWLDDATGEGFLPNAPRDAAAWQPVLASVASSRPRAAVSS